MKSIFHTAFLSLIILSQISYAQDDNNNNRNNNNQEDRDVSHNNRRFWEANLAGGSYMVAIDRISAISKHSYMVKSFIVNEVNIQINGAGLVRFYTFSPAGENSESNVAKNLIDRGKGLIDQAGKRTGIDPNSLVEKEYAVTTHSHTIEFKLFDNSDLDQLYNSVKRSWEEGRGRKFTIN
jgi:hypothetical protein